MAKHILLGVTGSVAAYKAAELIRQFRKADCEVKVILTENGSRFITPLTLETLSNNPVVCDMFSRETPYEVEHISLAKWADVFVVAPASANFIAKYTYGVADDMLTTTVLATKAPVIIAPAMNTAMYEHITVQSNMKILRERGVRFVEPDSGFLACGDVGKGRMEEPAEICSFVLRLLNGDKTDREKKDLCGRTVLVTAGATIEDIDPVRYLTNRSTGKMGVAIANAAAKRGAKVTLVAGNVKLCADSSVRRIDVRSTHDMAIAVGENIADTDVCICAAAPADFTPKAKADEKIKKNGENGLSLELVPTEDILLGIAKDKGKRLHIGFAAETNDVENNARKKLEAKGLDAIAANDVSKSDCGFAVDTNALTMFFSDGRVEKSGLMQKSDVADWLLDKVTELLRRSE